MEVTQVALTYLHFKMHRFAFLAHSVSYRSLNWPGKKPSLYYPKIKKWVPNHSRLECSNFEPTRLKRPVKNESCLRWTLKQTILSRAVRQRLWYWSILYWYWGNSCVLCHATKRHQNFGAKYFVHSNPWYAKHESVMSSTKIWKVSPHNMESIRYSCGSIGR